MSDRAVAQWQKIEKRLEKLGCISEAGLRPGASAQDLDALEKDLGTPLPESMKAFLSIHDGQDGVMGIALGWKLLSVEAIRSNWQVWRDIDEEEMNADSAEFMASEPQGYIRPMYTNGRWIPLTHDWSGNHVGLDFDPDVQGSLGQVILFGADEQTKRLVASNFDAFVEKLIDWLEGATWTGSWLEGAPGTQL